MKYEEFNILNIQSLVMVKKTPARILDDLNL